MECGRAVGVLWLRELGRPSRKPVSTVHLGYLPSGQTFHNPFSKIELVPAYVLTLPSSSSGKDTNGW